MYSNNGMVLIFFGKIKKTLGGYIIIKYNIILLSIKNFFNKILIYILNIIYNYYK